MLGLLCKENNDYYRLVHSFVKPMFGRFGRGPGRDGGRGERGFGGRGGRGRGRSRPRDPTPESSGGEETEEEVEVETSTTTHSHLFIASLYPLRETFGDVTFQIMSTGDMVKANRIVLVAACEHFETMFTAGFSESTSTVIPIHDASVEAFELFIKYCYFRDKLFDGLKYLFLDVTLLFEFMKLCDRYNIQSACEMTSKLVLSRIRRNSTEGIRILAKAYDADCIVKSWIIEVAALFKHALNLENTDRLSIMKTTLEESTQHHKDLYIAILEYAAKI